MPDTIKRYHEVMTKLKEYKGGKCFDCGETALELLEFHHLYPEDKSFTISNHWSYSYDSLIEEVDKCELICYDCHKDRHIPEHGTLSFYKHRGCRCKECKAANTAYTEEYRRRKGRKKY